MKREVVGRTRRKRGKRMSKDFMLMEVSRVLGRVVREDC